jgi:hypothetical protein
MKQRFPSVATIISNLLFLNASVLFVVFASWISDAADLHRGIFLAMAFIGPLLLMILFMLVNRMAIQKWSAGEIDPDGDLMDAVNTTYGASTLILVLVLFSMMFMDLKLGPALRLMRESSGPIALEDAPRHRKSGMAQFRDGVVVDRDHSGVFRRSYKRYHKAGGYYAKGTDAYWVFPVVPKNWDGTKPVFAWMAEYLDTPKGEAEKRPELLRIEAAEVRGIPVTYLPDYKTAANHAAKRHGLSFHPDALFLTYTETRPEEVVRRAIKLMAILLGVMNAVGLLVHLVMTKSVARKATEARVTEQKPDSHAADTKKDPSAKKRRRKKKRH